MSYSVFPVLPGQGWSVIKGAKFSTRTQRAVSGRETRVLDQILPIWTWTLTYDLLRDKNDTRSGGALGATFDELRTIAGFFLQMQGAFQAFAFNDPSDNAVTGQSIGIGNGSQLTFQLQRTFGGFAEPILAPHTVSHVYVDGVDSGGWSVNSDTGVVTFLAAPANAKPITADFTYYFKVRFSEDSAEFENFMYQLWQLKQIKLQSVLS